MIADLRVKGKDSAGKLRKALYSMFDLDVLEAAILSNDLIERKEEILSKPILER